MLIRQLPPVPAVTSVSALIARLKIVGFSSQRLAESFLIKNPTQALARLPLLANIWMCSPNGIPLATSISLPLWSNILAVSEAQKWFQQKNIRELELNTVVGNGLGEKFWEKMGFSLELKQWSKILSP